MLHLPYTPALPVRTRRLELRAFRPEDHAALLTFHSDPDVVRYVPFGPRTPERMTQALGSKIAGTQLAGDGDHLDLAVVLHDGTLVGDLVVMLHAVEHQSLELGWIFDPAVAGQGYATEAVSALLKIAFDGVGAHRLVARVDARNGRSRALCVRLGMRLEAELIENEWFKGEWSSEADYAMLGTEWRDRPRASVSIHG